MRLEPLADTLTAIMLKIALAQSDPDDRRAMLTVLHIDGHLTDEQFLELTDERRAA